MLAEGVIPQKLASVTFLVPCEENFEKCGTVGLNDKPTVSYAAVSALEH